MLQSLLKNFIQPLSKVLKEEDKFTIFHRIKVNNIITFNKNVYVINRFDTVQELYETHKDFHLDLIKSQYSSVRLSDVFLNWKEQFLVYADYCANLTTAQDRLQDLCNNDEFINREVNVRLNLL